VGQDIEADFRSTIDLFDFEILVVPTLKLAQDWTALGAKEQNGYGVVKLHRARNGQKIPLTVSKIQQNLFPGQRWPDMLPALTDFFFCRVRFRPKGGDWWKDLKEFQLALNGKVSDSQGTVTLRNQITVSNVAEWFKQDCFPLVPVLKNWLRYTVFASLNEGQSNFVFGTVDTVCPRCYEKVNKRWDKHKRCGCDLKRHKPIERVRSKIGLSFAYKVRECWEFRVWGWMPQQEVLDTQPRQLSLDREKDFLKPLYESFKPDGSLWQSGPFKNVAELCQPWHWRELGSDRDSTGSIYTDSYEFLRSLVIAKEAS